MKYLLFTFTLLLCFTMSAQTFEWNSKSGAASTKEVQPPGNLQAYEKAYNERQSGLAGIYNPSLHNSRTIYGETYNSAELTASHGILPLGTLIKVVNLDNSRNVTVRVNDRGQECSDCLVMLSQAAADALGVNYRGRVSVERVGFSNWNPAPSRTNTQSAPVAYGSAPAYNQPTGSAVVRPVAIGGETVGWQAKGSPVQSAPAAYGSTPAYGQQPGQVTPQQQQAAPRGEYAVLGTPSVMSREVDPASQPATYSRRPTIVTPQQQTQQTQPAYQRQPQVYQPQVYQQQVQQQQAYRQPTYQQPTYQQPTPGQVAPQAAPPQPTVPRYQAKGTAAPESYGQQARNTPAPTAYAALPAPSNTARTGYAVQLGAYNNELYAKNRVDQLTKAGMTNIFYVASTKADGQVINRVYAGTFPSMADAQAAANGIRNTHQIAGIVTNL